MCLKCVVLLLSSCYLTAAQNGVKSREKRALEFAPGMGIGVFIALAVPIDLPDRNVFVSFNFETVYSLASNFTALDLKYDEIIEPDEVKRAATRAFDRTMAYLALEKKIESSGHPGTDCLLRTICEAADTPLGHNGVLGDILHVVFSPSTSRDEGLPSVFSLAEEMGQSGNCTRYQQKCPISILGMFTKVQSDN